MRTKCQQLLEGVPVPYRFMASLPGRDLFHLPPHIHIAFEYAEDPKGYVHAPNNKLVTGFLFLGFCLLGCLENRLCDLFTGVTLRLVSVQFNIYIPPSHINLL